MPIADDPVGSVQRSEDQEPGLDGPWWRSPLRFWRRVPWDRLDYWALDLETSGLDARRHRVESVGMVPIRGGRVCWGERWYREVRATTTGSVGRRSIAIHGLLPDRRSEAPELGELLPEIEERLAGAVLLLHHGRLDLAFLDRAHRRAGRPWRRPPVVDTVHLLSRLSHRRRQLEPYAEPLPGQLGEARHALGLPPHREHHALDDALATAELMLALRARLRLCWASQLV